MVEADYSGWPTKTEGARGAELALLTSRLRAQVAAGDDAALRQAVTDWLAWFDDGHLRAQWSIGDTDKAWTAPRRPLSDQAARRALAAAGDAHDPPHDPVDPDGIAPDVHILADTDDSVAWAATWLARNKAEIPKTAQDSLERTDQS